MFVGREIEPRSGLPCSHRAQLSCSTFVASPEQHQPEGFQRHTIVEQIWGAIWDAEPLWRHWTIFNGWTKWKSWKFSFSRNARIHGSRHRAGDCCHATPWRQQPRSAQARGTWMTRQHTEDRQLYNRTFPTSRAHRGSLSKRRELVLSSLFLGELLQLVLGLVCLKWTELCVFFYWSLGSSFCSKWWEFLRMRVFALSSSLFSLFVGLLAPSDRSCCAVQLVFLAFRLSFPPSRRAALRMPRLTTRSASRSSRSSQPPRPTSNNDKPPSSTEPSPSPSSSQPLRLSGSPRRSAASKASWLRRDQQHRKPSPPPWCYRRTFASSNVRARSPGRIRGSSQVPARGSPTQQRLLPMRPTMASPARQTRPARLIHDFKLSPACTKNACVTWHPAPSPPQHRDALSLVPFPTHCQQMSQIYIVGRATQYILVTGCRVILCCGGASSFVLQCIKKKKKKSKTLDKRSTLTFAANCTERKLSSSES